MPVIGFLHSGSPDQNAERAAASAKFDASGIETEIYEGQPVIKLRTDDLT
jgi:hypothetical protein